MFYRTSGRVDNELIAKREIFLTDAEFVGGAFFMDPQQTIAVVEIGAAAAVDLHLPNPSLCKGLSAAVRGVVDKAGELVITNLGGGRTVSYTGAGTDLTVSSFFISDGAEWYTTSGVSGAAGLDGTVWTHGGTTPDDGDGNDGDYYLRTGAGGGIYYKESSSWGLIANLGDITV